MSDNLIEGGKLLTCFVALSIIIILTERAVQILHWSSMGFTGMWAYQPFIPILGLVGVTIYFIIILLTKAKEHWYFYVLGATWLIYDIVMLWCVVSTYGWGIYWEQTGAFISSLAFNTGSIFTPILDYLGVG